MSMKIGVLGVFGQGLIGDVNSINERGGIRRRKINLIALDDGYTPPKTVEMTRRLIESEAVAFIVLNLRRLSGARR